MNIAIRPAAAADARQIFDLVRELADYERLSHEVDTTAEQIAAVLFAERPTLFCDVAEWNGEVAGFAMWFLNFSSFRGRHGIYLEDLFVRPAFRGHGIGKALMRNLAQRCLERSYARFEWAVLDWNRSAIDFYRGIGAELMDQWRVCRMTGPALTRFAGGER